MEKSTYKQQHTETTFRMPKKSKAYSLASDEGIEGIENTIDSIINDSELPEVRIEGSVLLWRLKDYKKGYESETSILNKELAAVKYQLWNKLTECDLYFDGDAFEEILKEYIYEQRFEDIEIDGAYSEVMVSGYSDQEIDTFISSDQFEEVVCNTCKLVGKLK